LIQSFAFCELDRAPTVIENSGAMSKENLDEFYAVTIDIENQLHFYREMGLDDIGGSLALTQEQQITHVSSTQFEATKSQDPVEQLDIPKQDRAPLDLFGEVISAGNQGGRKRSASLPILESNDPSLEAIMNDIGDCTRCRLHEQRKTIVFGEGDPEAKLVFVGEGPGAEEDASGRPFVGRAGQLLDKIIAAIGMKREDVYIANIVKCRPPGNRAPELDEVATCEPFLLRQLAFIRPKVIVALGSPSFQCLLRTREPITRARGQWREWNGIKVMPTFHPAFLLRSPDKKREVWEDMKKVRDYLNGESNSESA
jgi:uracil-DNA glycosylase family 4